MSVEPSGIVYYAALAAAGIVSGFAGGLFGIGGGLLRVPIFLYLFTAFGVANEVVFHMAAGTSLALAIPTSAASTWRQVRDGNIDVGLLRLWIPALLLGVAAGLLTASSSSTETLKVIFLVFLLILAVTLGRREPLVLWSHRPVGAGPSALAVGIGGLATLLGLSGGALITPAMVAFGQGIHRAVAFSSAASLAIGSVAAAGMVWTGIGVAHRTPDAIGFVDVPAFLVITPLVLVSAPLGVRVANRLADRPLQRAYSLLLVALAIDMAWGLVRG